jgi:hypothetical protein
MFTHPPSSWAVVVRATRPGLQPGGDSWVVLTDPEGHAFCLVADD